MIIGLTGKAGSGKDTVANYLAEEYSFAVVRLADPIREALYTLNPFAYYDEGGEEQRTLQDVVNEFGWDQAKRIFPEVRRLMQVFGTEVGRQMWNREFWINLADDMVYQHAFPNKRHVVIPDVRFPNEAEYVHSFTRDGNGRKMSDLWLITGRQQGEMVQEHTSEDGIPIEYINLNIMNDTSMGDLYSRVDHRMTELGVARERLHNP